MNYPVDIPALPVPGFIIYRNTNPGELVDHTQPPVFFPPKDSDELFDALRAKYPHVRTHSERMRDAIIEFLIEERQTEALSATVSPTALEDMASTSPWQQSWPSMSSSTFSSPETYALATPDFTTSPAPGSQKLVRQPSSATSPSGRTPPALEQMTSVFSLSASDQPKQRIRRKMTEAEKIEYRKRRIVKACDKCSKRKRKCIHNQPEMEVMPGLDKSGGRVTKSRSSPSDVLQIPSKRPSQQPDFISDMLALDPTIASNDFTGLDDFSFAYDETMPDFDFNDTLLFNPQQSFDVSDSSFGSCEHPFGGWDNLSSRTSSDQSPGATNGLGDTEWQAIDWASNMIPAINSNDARKSQRLPTGNRQDGLQSSGNIMLWEHLRTGQEHPPSTAQPHDGAARGIDPRGRMTLGPRPSDAQTIHPSLSQVVLQLVGTMKAVRAFAGPVIGRQLRHTTSETTHENCSAESPQGGRTVGGGISVESNRSSITVGSGLQGDAPGEAGIPGAPGELPGAPKGLSRAPGGLQGTSRGLPGAPGGLPGGPGGLPGASHGGASKGGLASTSASVSGRLGSSRLATLEGRPATSIDSSIVRGTSPSAELFRLKRQLPSALWTTTQAGNALQPRPLLQVRTEGTHEAASQDHDNVNPRLQVRTADNTTRGVSTAEAEQFVGRLMDHVRYRDHHGRVLTLQTETTRTPSCGKTSSIGFALGLAVLAGTLLRHMSSVDVGASMLILAVLATFGGNNVNLDVFSRRWITGSASLVQCSTKNSSWLALQRKMTNLSHDATDEVSAFGLVQKLACCLG